jgi:hypothetical protein
LISTLRLFGVIDDMVSQDLDSGGEIHHILVEYLEAWKDEIERE